MNVGLSGEGVLIAGNQAPTISEIHNQYTPTSTPISVTFTISDSDSSLESLMLYADSSNLSLVWCDLIGTIMIGDGISIHAPSGIWQVKRTMSITPTTGSTGSTNITVIVDDSEATDSVSFLLTVGENAPPTFTSMPQLTGTVGFLYNYDITSHDPDRDDTLVISAPVLPGWLTFTDLGNGTANLMGIPVSVAADNVELEVSDGQMSSKQAFTITVEQDVQYYLYLPLMIRQ